MTAPTERLPDFDLHAYVDGQLDIARRMEVEDYLSRHPEVAAQVMADLRTRDALRIAFGGAQGRPSPRLIDAARRVERGLAFTGVMRRMQRGGAGWLPCCRSAGRPMPSSVASRPARRPPRRRAS